MQNGLADKVKGMVIKVVSAQWKTLQEEIEKMKGN
jgi:hypothetical protein